MAKNGSASTPQAPSSSPAVSDFVRDAIREKVSREWAVLRHRGEGYDALDRIRAALDALSEETQRSAMALGTVVESAALGPRLKKMRKAIDEARSLAAELHAGLGVEEQRAKLAETRRSVTDAWKNAGLDEAELAKLGEEPEAAPAAPATSGAPAAETPAPAETPAD